MCVCTFVCIVPWGLAECVCMLGGTGGVWVGWGLLVVPRGAGLRHTCSLSGLVNNQTAPFFFMAPACSSPSLALIMVVGEMP